MESTVMPQVIHKKRSFLATLALGLSSLAAILVICLAGIFMYGMNIADRKTDNLLEFAGEVVRHVPQLREALPPILGDAISDERSVSYQSELDVAVKLVRPRPGSGEIWPVVEITNRGDRVVSFLSMRVVLLDRDGTPVAESGEWAATPIAEGDHGWRGPLFPGAKRSFRGRPHYPRDEIRQIPFEELRGEVEVTELRLWRPEGPRELRTADLRSRIEQDASRTAAY